MFSPPSRDIAGRMSTTSARPDSRREATRARLLDAGLRVFARYGYDGVSTRKLAAAAKVNISAIKYYFGGKEGYYLAVAHYIVDHHAGPMRQVIEQTHALLDAAGPEARKIAPAALENLFAGAANFIVPHQQGPALSSFILREQLQPTAAFDVIFEGLIRHMHALIARLVGLITGLPADDPQTLLRAHALFGQVLIFQNGRATVLRRLGWDRYTPERVEQISAVVRQLATSALRELATDATADKAKTSGE